MKKPVKLTAEDVVAKLNLQVDHIQKLKIQKLLNQIYAERIIPEQVVLDTILKIYLADPTLSALDDIYIITYNNTVKIEFKYSFWPKKLTELGVFKQVDAYVVREGEAFEIKIENGKTELKHTLNPFNTNAKIIGAYARGIKEDGTVVIATANKQELEAAAKASKVKAKGKKTIWDIWFEEVSKKVPLKRLVKLIPVPSEITQAINIEAENYASPEEIEEYEKTEDAKEAMEEFNKEISKTVTLQEVLDAYNIPYELKQGYIKVEKDIIERSLLKDVELPLLEFKKDPAFLVGKASSEVPREVIETQKEEEEINYHSEE